jgi:hypothetical protein
MFEKAILHTSKLVSQVCRQLWPSVLLAHIVEVSMVTAQKSSQGSRGW